MSHRIGYVHIPKTAGTALNASINKALDLQPAHIGRVVKSSVQMEDFPFVTLKKRTLGYNLAKNSPYLSGHISFSQMVELNRNFIFTVIREPNERLISYYTYQKLRSLKLDIQKSHPHLSQYQKIGFYDFLELTAPINSMSRLLLGDIDGFFKLVASEDKKKPSAKLLKVIETGLQRYNVIYDTSSLQNILDDLASRGLIRNTACIRVNESSNEVFFGELGNRKTLLKIMQKYTWLDQIVYSVAASVFPETVRSNPISDNEFIDYLSTRFGIIIPKVE